ncbi:X-box-binding protein 1 isoform X2 [Macrotis lagotis]|uniref:X-box-binding protein 1 isoform X2 n=1 Tax=Macrotis lagotis TaxID=92651 RepID=UPI003D6878C4
MMQLQHSERLILPRLPPPARPLSGNTLQNPQDFLTHQSSASLQRKKLKNRVAAQTARDRKKARMSELEQQVVDLEEENQKLLIENQLLRERTHGLVIENQELRQRLGMDALGTEEESESKVSDGRLVTGSAESAALRLRAPLQQVQAQLSPCPDTAPGALTLLILQTLSQISCWAFWTTWTQTCSSDMSAQNTAWRSSKRWEQKSPPPYQPPPLLWWGPHQPSWKPLMN